MKASNVNGMCETLGVVYNILEEIQPFAPHINDVSLMREFRSKVCRAKHIIDTALSAPPRNCDVGTVDEQIARHYRYCSCRLGDGDDPHCCGHISCSECVIRWEQMEYKEEGKQ